jgi:preprotein translocase subunit YajC
MENSAAQTYSQILYTNWQFFGIDVQQKLIAAGEKIAAVINEKYAQDKEIALTVHDNLHAKIGLAAALGLAATRTVHLYMLCRPQKLEDKAAQDLWHQIQNSSQIILHTDVATKDIAHHQVFVLSLGPDATTKRSKEAIKRITHFREQIVNLEEPASGYAWDLSISLDFPKTTDAVVINADLPLQLQYAGPGELNALAQPRTASYKRDNGKLLVIYQTISDAQAQLLRQISEVYSTNLTLISLAELGETPTTSALKALAENDSVYLFQVDLQQLAAHSLVSLLINNAIDKQWISLDVDWTQLNTATPPQKLIHAYTSVTTLPASSKHSQQYLLRNGTHVSLQGTHFYTGKQTSLLSPHWGLDIATITTFAAVFSTRNHPWLASAAALFCKLA